MIPIVIKAFGDCDDRWNEPAIDGQGRLDLDPGEVVVGSMTAKAMTLTVGSGPNARELLSLDDQPIEVKVTSARVVYRCAEYDTGGGWVGFGVAGFATAAIANSVSKRRAAKRSADTVLTGQLRFPWLAAVGGSAKEGWLDSDTLLLRGSTPKSAGDESVTLQFDLPAGSDTRAIAADIARRAATYRLEREPLNSDETAALTELAAARPLNGSGRSVSMHAAPTYYPIGTGERVFWPVPGAETSPAPAPEQPTELHPMPSAPNAALAAERSVPATQPAPAPVQRGAAPPAARLETPASGGVSATGEPPIDWPHYGIGFAAAIKRGFTKYASFSGRASRSEFWWWSLFTFLAYLTLALLLKQFDNAEVSSPFLWAVIIFWLVFAVPTLSLSFRRLHDTGRSGAMLLIGLIPLVGSWILLAYLAGGTTMNASRYGPPGGGWGITPPVSGAAERSVTRQRRGTGRGPVVAFVAAILVLVVIGGALVVRNWRNFDSVGSSASGTERGYEGGGSGETGDRGVVSDPTTSDPTDEYEPPTGTEPSDEPFDQPSDEPSDTNSTGTEPTTPTRATGMVPMGSLVQLGHFSVQVTALTAEPGEGMLVTTEVCVTTAIAETDSGLTKVTWNPWTLIVSGDGIRPRVADSSYPPVSMFPKEGLHEVGDCVNGDIPFADVDAESPIEAVRYLNGKREKAVWAVTGADGTSSGSTGSNDSGANDSGSDSSDAPSAGGDDGSCGPSLERLRQLRDHPELKIRSKNCSTVDPDWTIVEVEYERGGAGSGNWAYGSLYFSRIDGEWVQAHDDIGAHAGGLCEMYHQRDDLPSDFKPRLQQMCG